MILIASGAYLQGDFVSEVGLLPPSFLPIGNKRLFEYQLDFLRKDQSQTNIYLSIPLSYQLDLFDEKHLSTLGVIIIRVPDGLSLGESILFCWNAFGNHDQPLTLLHGDTLFLNASFTEQNIISVHNNTGFYHRASFGSKNDSIEKVHDDWATNNEQVISGYFNFSLPLKFMESLVETKKNFIKAIVKYHQKHPFKLIKNGEWLDFGHINSFFNSRTKLTTQRWFNELKMTSRIITKSSTNNTKKIFAEGSWFVNLPLALKLYTPSLLEIEKNQDDYQNASYQLEYLYLLPLSDLYVFTRLPAGLWQTIFNAIAKMLKDFEGYRPEKISTEEFVGLNDLYLPKTLERLDEFVGQSGYDLNSTYSIDVNKRVSLLDIIEEISAYIRPISHKDVAVSHGDLCFSNILFDFRAGGVKCIDPRGISSKGELTIYGDRRYDIAKLYHSVVGLYDFIIAGRFSYLDKSENTDLLVEQNLQNYDEIIKSFNHLVLYPSGYDEKEILAITIHLFLSMLPLHSDRPECQSAFIANAIRLFKLFKEVE